MMEKMLSVNGDGDVRGKLKKYNIVIRVSTFIKYLEAVVFKL